MKITIYELLRLVKDGKAPQKIKYEYSIYELTPERNNYYCKNNMRWFTNEINSLEVLNDEVEMIEEPKKIEKIEIYEDEDGHYFLNNRNDKIYIRCDETDFMVYKFNELIDEINNLKEERK